MRQTQSLESHSSAGLETDLFHKAEIPRKHFPRNILARISACRACRRECHEDPRKEKASVEFKLNAGDLHAINIVHGKTAIGQLSIRLDGFVHVQCWGTYRSFIQNQRTPTLYSLLQ